MTENIQEKSGSINDILKIVNRANETFIYEIFVPSLNRKLMFRELNTSQQKRILKAVIDSPAYNTEFIYALRTVIKENCVEEIDVDNFTILDKMIIAMTMRSIGINNDLDLQFNIPNSEEKIIRRINLKDLINVAITNIKINPISIKDDTGIFEIVCGLPTIADEFNLENELHKNSNNIDIKNEKELRETVGEVFTNEIIKYIKQVNIKNENNEIITIDLKPLKFKDRIAILEKLPAKVNIKIIEYINSVNKEFEKVLLFSEEINGKKIEQRLKIDSSFFTPS